MGNDVFLQEKTTQNLRRYSRDNVAQTAFQPMYIHERANWTAFRWDAAELTTLLEAVSHKRGRLYGRLTTLGFDSKLRTMAENLTYDIVYSSEIEGIRLNVDEVRSSIARRLGIENIKQAAPSHYVESVVDVLTSSLFCAII